MRELKAVPWLLAGVGVLCFFFYWQNSGTQCLAKRADGSEYVWTYQYRACHFYQKKSGNDFFGDPHPYFATCRRKNWTFVDTLDRDIWSQQDGDKGFACTGNAGGGPRGPHALVLRD